MVVTKKIFAEGTAASWARLVQQTVQIVASHDLTLVVVQCGLKTGAAFHAQNGVLVGLARLLGLIKQER